jgi:hypothetical protein
MDERGHHPAVIIVHLSDDFYKYKIHPSEKTTYNMHYTMKFES